MPIADPIQAAFAIRCRLETLLKSRSRITIRILGIAVVGLLALGVTHALQTARLEVVVSTDQSGPPAVGDPGFIRTAVALAEAPMVEGNDVRVLSNGSETYAVLLEDLASAERSITMQMYYGKPGVVSDAVFGVLAERARRGVLVRFMYDAIGTEDMPERYRRALAGAGVRTAAFRPFRWRDLARFGYRAHTRAVVIDGRIGYTGGFGLDDKWLGDGRRRGEWRETNVRFTGPAVAQLQAAFLEEWGEATGELLIGGSLFPALPSDAGDYTAGLLHSLPGAGPSPAERALALSIAGSRHTLYVSNAYFLPNAGFRELLAAAARRGVDVRVLTNGRETDNSLTQLASRQHYEELLSDGVRLFEYQPTMMHAKTFVVDGVWSSIGSMNFDNRSLALNSETTLLVLDRRTGSVMDSLFRVDLEASEEILLERFRRRPWIQRVLERGAGVLARAL
jgi:cardiolipin synthase